jgi:large-conductance mechanosensitive channel
LFTNVVVESVAFVLFLVVKGINSMKKQQAAATAATTAPTKEDVS